MAVLSDLDRDDITAQFIRAYFVGLAHTADLDTDEVHTLINDVDVWLDSQATEANQAITSAIRTKASTQTKFAALAWVALKRAGAV